MFTNLRENRIMRNSFLKTSTTQEMLVVDGKTGQLLQHDVKKIKYLANTKEEFYFFYSSLISLMQTEMTGPEMKVFAYLLQRYLVGTDIALPKALKENMAEYLKIKLGTVNNVLSSLTDKKLIFSTQRAIYKINPRHAFKGSTKKRNDMLKLILELECPNC